MDRAIPSFNRLVVDKIHHRNMQTHYQKLFNIHHSKRVRTETSASISISKPAPNAKRHQLLEERSTEIDKSNVILFQKMNRIMHRADPLNANSQHLKINSRRFATHLNRVNEENQQFLERLCRMKPTIDNKKILEERRKQIAILKSLGRNSYHGRPKDKSDSCTKRPTEPSAREDTEERALRSKRDMEESSSLKKFSLSYMMPLNPRPRYTEGDYNPSDELRESEMYFRREMLKIEEKRNKIQSSLTQYEPSEPNNEIRHPEASQRTMEKESVFLHKSIVLYATFKKVDGLIYKVEIQRRHQAYQIVCFQVDAAHRTLLLTLQEAEGNELLSSIDYDYQALIDSLQIEGGRLSISRRRLQGRNCEVDEGFPGAIKMRINKNSLKNPSHITEQSIEHEHSMLYDHPSEESPSSDLHNK